MQLIIIYEWIKENILWQTEMEKIWHHVNFLKQRMMVDDKITYHSFFLIFSVTYRLLRKLNRSDYRCLLRNCPPPITRQALDMSIRISISSSSSNLLDAASITISLHTVHIMLLPTSFFSITFALHRSTLSADIVHVVCLTHRPLWFFIAASSLVSPVSFHFIKKSLRYADKLNQGG